MRRSYVSLGFWIALCLLVGGIGAFVSQPDAWYESLSKPSWTPPNSVFAPVWIALYIIMGISAWLIWQRRDIAKVFVPLTLFILQLALNGMWSFIFFGKHRPDFAFADIVLLWFAILATTVAFWRVRWLAAIMMLPYLTWVTFAGCLNAAIAFAWNGQ